MFKMSPLAGAMCVAWMASGVVLAQESSSVAASPATTTPAPTATQSAASSDEPIQVLKTVVVTSTRTERDIDDIPATATVVTQEQIEKQGARDIKDMLSDEVDVSVRAAQPRFTAAGSATGRAGVEGINIRGLEGNQVLMVQDGIRIPNAFSFAAFSTGRGDYIDVDGLKSAEILRGPASTQFGSDGLAGVVSFRTLDPSDVLKNGQNVGGFYRSGYSSVDKSWVNTLGVAGVSGRWQAMVLGSYRQGHEVGNQGANESMNSNRTAPNPVDYNNRSFLGKAIYSANAANQIGLTLESQHRKQDTDVYTARSPSITSASSVSDENARDVVKRNRISLEHHFDDADESGVQKADTRVYYQTAKISQFTSEVRPKSTNRTRDNAYDYDVYGLSTVLQSKVNWGVEQRLSYGVDVSQAKIKGVRDGTVPPVGESFPSKPFPDTTYSTVGGFVQSEIEAGKVSIIPALRFDYYDLIPSSAGYTGSAVNLMDSAVTPRLGVVWRLKSYFAPYAQWSQGFRAPTPDQVNNGFVNPIYGYASVGNSNLKAEHARSLEFGFRGEVKGLRYSMALWDNHYKNFISQEQVSGSFTASDPAIYQYINLSEAHITGFDARAEWSLTKNWSLKGGFAYAKGDSEKNGVKTPLDTVNPFKAIVGAVYDNDKWSARLNVTHSSAKTSDRIATAGSFSPPSYTVVDLGGDWKVNHHLTLNANINNLFDQKYWRWSDVRGILDSSTVKDAYTAPGRNFQVSIKYSF